MKIKTIVVVGLSSMAFMSASAEWITAEFVARVRPCFSSFLVKPRIDHGEIVAVSPDGRNKIRINLNPMSVEVIRDGKTVVAPGRISMKIDGCSLSEGPSILKPAVSTRRITGEVDAVMYKKRRVSLACVEKLADFGDWAIRMVARDDGVAYRFEIRRNGKVRVDGEHADFSVPDGSVRCWAHFTDRFGCEETIFQASTASEVNTDLEKHRMIYSPFVYRIGDTTVAILESDVRDYPVRYFKVADSSSGRPYFRSVFAGWPMRTRHTADRKTSLERGGRWVEVVEHCDWLVETDGMRTFPWRAFAIAGEPSRLMENDIVYALAQPVDASHDFSWVKPGKVAWDWWNAFDNKGDPDGCTTETYLRFVDFAAKNGIEYVIMDEGWSEKLDIWRFSPRVDVKKVIDHANRCGVGIILWMSWAQIVGEEDRVASYFARLGAKGFKVDFIDRGDAAAERFLWKFAESCRKEKMVVDYHGSHRPVGMERAYPNVLNYEGVRGLEAMKFNIGNPAIVANDVAICFTRMTAGPLDYTPGAMDNYVIGGYPKRNIEEGRRSYVFINPGSYGTRSRQMAMMVLYSAPLQMLCDSPTKYERNIESFAFMAAVPTTWDETRALGGDPDSCAIVARRKDDVWYVAGITSAESRDFVIDTSFLPSGAWDVEMFRDSPDTAAKPTSYKHDNFTLRSGEKIAVHMASAGGFIARITRSSSAGVSWARPDLVAKVISGEIKEAYASWWGFDKEDSTRYLQAAVNSGAVKLIVEKMPSPWVVTPIRGASNQHIVFEKGAVLLAKRGEFVGRNDWLFYYLFAENAKLTGYGATFRMWREDYAHGKDGKGFDYKRGEWRHSLAIRNSRNITVEGLTLEESGGDGANVGLVVKPGCGPVGVDYGTGNPAAFCRDIVLRDIVCDRNHRQGLSICSVENLSVENCIFKNTKGTWPMSGVDIEPDSPSNRIVNCVFRNCLAENNAGNGFEVALQQLRKTSAPVSIRFENCRTIGSRNAVYLRTGAPVTDGGYPQGSIDFDGCSFEECGFSALHVLQIPENSIKVKFRNCRASSFGKVDSAASLVFLEAPRFDDPLPAVPDISGLVCNLDTDSHDRIRFSTRNFATLGERTMPRLSPEVVDARIIDLSPGEFVQCTSPRMQGSLRFAVYADRARKVRIRARRVIPDGPKRPLPKGEIAVMDMSDVSIAKIPLPDYETAELSFDAPERGFYWLSAMVKVGALDVEATDAPIAADCTRFDYRTWPLRFHVSTGSVYIPVEAGQEAAFVVGGDTPGARIGMRVYEPDGKMVFKKESVLEWTRYVTPIAEKDGLWSIAFDKPSISRMWAYYAEVTGVRPFFFLSRDKFWFSR